MAAVVTMWESRWDALPAVHHLSSVRPRPAELVDQLVPRPRLARPFIIKLFTLSPLRLALRLTPLRPELRRIGTKLRLGSFALMRPMILMLVIPPFFAAALM